MDGSGVHPWLLLGQVHKPVSWVKIMCFYRLHDTRLVREHCGRRTMEGEGIFSMKRY